MKWMQCSKFFLKCVRLLMMIVIRGSGKNFPYKQKQMFQEKAPFLWTLEPSVIRVPL